MEVCLIALVYFRPASVSAFFYRLAFPSFHDLAVFATLGAVFSFVTVVWVVELPACSDSILAARLLFLSLAFVEFRSRAVLAFFDNLTFPAFDDFTILAASTGSFPFVTVILVV